MGANNSLCAVFDTSSLQKLQYTDIREIQNTSRVLINGLDFVAVASFDHAISTHLTFWEI